VSRVQRASQVGKRMEWGLLSWFRHEKGLVVSIPTSDVT